MTLSGRSKETHAVVLANGVNGYGALRSLASAGIPSVVIAPSHDDLSFRSRLSSRRIVLTMDTRWETELLHLLPSLGLPPLSPIIACSDRAAMFLQTYRADLEPGFGLLIPDGVVIERLNDKREELELMQAHGTRVPASVTRLPDVVPGTGSLRFPVIIKPRTFVGYRLLGAKNLIVRNAQSWSEFLGRYAKNLDAFIAQEVIQGEDTNLWVCNATADRQHRLVRFFSFRRLGTSPAHFGVTSLARSEYNKHLEERVQQIVTALGYVGPLMMEFKWDDMSQDYLYIETNPRLGMCNWFDTVCGIHNVEATCILASGGTVPTNPRQRDGIIFVHALADLTARLEDREGPTSILSRYWRLRMAPKAWAVFDERDLRPFLASLSHMLRDLLLRLCRYVLRRSAQRLVPSATVEVRRE